MYNNSTIDANEIEDFLLKKHSKDLVFSELRLSSGFEWQGRIDFLAINVSPSKGNPIIAYEIKISKADFKRDTHKKQRGARLFSDRFFYIAPAGVIPPEDVPDWAGLIELSWTAPQGARTPFLCPKEVIPAPKRDKDAPTWGLVVSIIRNARKDT